MQACHSFLNGLAYGASFAPIPGLPIVLQLLDQILRCAENVKVNKYSGFSCCCAVTELVLMFAFIA